MNISFKEVTSFIYKSVNPFKFSIFVMLMVGIIWAIDLSLKPYILKMIIDRISTISNQNIFEHVGFLIVIYFLTILILPLIFRFYDYFVTIKMIPPLRRNIANLSFHSLLQQSYSYYQNNFAGSLTNKINDLTGYIPDIIQIVMDKFFAHGLAVIVAIITLWQINPIFALGMLGWVILCIAGSFFLSTKLTGLADKWSEYNSAITGKLVDSLSNILSIRLFARDKDESSVLSANFDESVKAEQKLQWTYFWMWCCVGFSFVIVQGTNLYFLLKGRQDGWITTGDFVVVLGINFAIIDLLWSFAKDFSQFSTSWGKITQALRAIQVIPEIQDKLDAKELRITNGQITFNNVKFHYKGTNPLFENKSVTIKPGEKVGLVGYSGSGKTTFINLILRLYEVTEGQILIDKQNITDVTQNSLRENIGMIPQDPTLFHRSIMDNIRYGRIDAMEEEVIAAAKAAHAHEFIMNLPEKYNALVGERGVKLSGGQRQRIAIARAFLKNAPILILDEATSQLDSITESDIQESLWKLMQDKTTIIIAHRLSTLLHMDRIIAFDKGKIVGDGTHQELLEQDGLYKTLWNAQVGGFLPDKKN